MKLVMTLARLEPAPCCPFPHAGSRLLRYDHRWRAGRPHQDDAPRRRRPKDGGELPRALHGREGHGEERQAAPLQGLCLPPRHHQLHVPGRRLHGGQRHRRRVHLRRQVCRRELPAQAHRPGHPLDGQRRPGHQRLPVLPLHRQDGLARRQARRLWLRHQGHGGGQGGRGGRLAVGQDGQAGGDRRLRPDLVGDTPCLDAGRSPAHISVLSGG
mmetsp:Transcript_14775/g.47961  ORF Transcript_14775/g.47961 Transcript_14775/m.47961 type:complete len:213 (-) Transcript_14775:221-859(-)